MRNVHENYRCCGQKSDHKLAKKPKGFDKENPFLKAIWWQEAEQNFTARSKIRRFYFSTVPRLFLAYIPFIAAPVCFERQLFAHFISFGEARTSCLFSPSPFTWHRNSMIQLIHITSCLQSTVCCVALNCMHVNNQF